MSGRNPDPYGAHRFRVVPDGLPPLGFTAVRGLAVEVAVRDVDSSTSEDGPRVNRPPRFDRPVPEVPPARRETRSPPLELRRGVSDDRTLRTWLQEWVAGEVGPRDVRVCLLDGAGRPVCGWICRAATPVRWSGPDLVAGRATVATETLELTHEGIDAVIDLDECVPDG